MGWSQFVHGSYGYPRGRQADDLDKWARARSAQAREAAKPKPEPAQRPQPARDTLELSGRQQQKIPVLRPVPIFTTSGFTDYSA